MASAWDHNATNLRPRERVMVLAPSGWAPGHCFVTVRRLLVGDLEVRCSHGLPFLWTRALTPYRCRTSDRWCLRGQEGMRRASVRRVRPHGGTTIGRYLRALGFPAETAWGRMGRL